MPTPTLSKPWESLKREDLEEREERGKREGREREEGIIFISIVICYVQLFNFCDAVDHVYVPGRFSSQDVSS